MMQTHEKSKCHEIFTFNKNEELRMETSSNVPGLPIEGELAETTVDDGSNLAPDQTRGETSKTQPSETQTLHTCDANIDYQKMNNPQAQPTV